mmetsp:Transcript_22514/g.50709  ORF Transcript_22514/g.50709 Transcript_22514/m.50709 type:complete len:315 (-) Transcript_22514:333-1277(-)
MRSCSQELAFLSKNLPADRCNSARIISFFSILSCLISSCSRWICSSFFLASNTLSGSAACASALFIAALGMAWIVSLRASSSAKFCVILKALDIRRRVVGTFFFKLKSSQFSSMFLYALLVSPTDLIPRYMRASRSSKKLRDSTPSISIIRSSLRMARILSRRRYLRNESVPNTGMSSNRQRFTSCILPTLSRVMSSVKSLENLMISSFETLASPRCTLFMNSTNLSAVPSSIPTFLIDLAISFIASCKNPATSILAFSFLFMSSSFFHSCWKVEGRIPGKAQRMTGSASSMNGTSTMIANGTILRRSVEVVLS